MTHFLSRAAVTLLAVSMLTGTAERADLRRSFGATATINLAAITHNPAKRLLHNKILLRNTPPRISRSNRRCRAVRPIPRTSKIAAAPSIAIPADSSPANTPPIARIDLRAPDIGLWFNGSPRDSLVISDVSSRGPIARLGFREGDRIVSVNGHRVAREADFIDYLFGADRDRVEVIVNRDGRDETIWVEPAQFTQDDRLPTSRAA